MKFNPKVPYTINLPTNISSRWGFKKQGIGSGVNHAYTAANYGFNSLYSPMFNRGGF